MREWNRRILTLVLAVLLLLPMIKSEGRAVLDGVYFTAVDEQLLELSEETMPFYSGGELYISSKFFEGTDIGVRYVRNRSMGLAVLYTTKTDLRFDLVNRTVYDKTGVYHEGWAIEKNGYVFFPVELVCDFFGLRWSMSATETVPLLRLRTDSSILSDRRFIDAASGQMSSRYDAYEKMIASREPDEPDDPEIHAAEGQKVYLILASRSPEDTHETVRKLGENRATFLLTAEQMKNGDLLRMLVGTGHGVALMISGETAEEAERELAQGRELMWQAAHSVLHLVWYDGGSDDMGDLLARQGCVAVRAEIDRRNTPIRSESRVMTLLNMIGRHREDVPVYLGYDSDCAEGIELLVGGLTEAQYRLCAWRLNA